MKYASVFLCLSVVTVQLASWAGGDADLARFAAVKEAQAREFVAELTNKVPDITWSFFDAVKVDDWETATNLGTRLERASGRYAYSEKKEFSEALHSPVWQTISETYGAYELFHNWDRKWLRRFGKNIIEAIPQGSIYFGGTDSGRYLITLFCESQREGKPFFTITQNQLADGTYLEYVRKLYGKKIYVASEADSQKAFEAYLADAQTRLQTGKLKPGEDVRIIDNKVQVSGQVAVMTINGLIAKVIVEKNSDREIFIEESFPLDWMYPQLSPHGLIMKLESKPLSELRETAVQKDRDYWKGLMTEIFGDVVTEKSSIKDACDFVEKIYLRKELADFKGDSTFVKNDEAQKAFSKLRSSIGGLYAWRAEHAKDGEEKERTRKAADFSFRQAFVLCPYSPEVIFRYTQLLVNWRRFDEAILICKMGLRFDENNAQFKELLRTLSQYSK